MASTSAPRAHSSAASRIPLAANNLSSDAESLISDIRKSLGMIKTIAIDLEKDKQSDKVNQLEDSVLELLESYDDCTRFADAMRSIGSNYQPSEAVVFFCFSVRNFELFTLLMVKFLFFIFWKKLQGTDFKKMVEAELSRLNAAMPSAPQKNPLYRGFKEAVWHIHHAGQAMPGEEQEDIVMTSTQTNILNNTCPLTGKPIFELQDPVRCTDCKHIYEKDPIMEYIRKKAQPICPVAGCPKVLQAGRVFCDSELKIDIEEMHSADNVAAHATVVEDFTDIDEEMHSADNVAAHATVVEDFTDIDDD